MGAGELAALAAALTWAIGSLLFGRIGRTVPPGAMNLGKLVAAGAMLALTHLVISRHPFLPPGVAGSALVLLALSGVAGLTIGDTAYFGAIVALGVPRAILLLSSAPVFAALIGWLWLGERVALRAVLGIGLTLSGIVLVVARRAVGGPPLTARGLALGMVAALGQASGSVLSRKAMQGGFDPLAAAVGRIAVGAIGLWAVAWATGHARGWHGALAKDRAWLWVSLTAMIGSYGGIWLSQLALAHASSTGVASTLLATSPVFALPLAHFFGGERMTGRSAIGVLLAMAGIALLVR